MMRKGGLSERDRNGDEKVCRDLGKKGKVMRCVWVGVRVLRGPDCLKLDGTCLQRQKNFIKNLYVFRCKPL